MNEATRILSALEQRDVAAANELLPPVYQELRKVAAHYLSDEAPGPTLRPTAVVHETTVRWLGPAEDGRWNGRRHFMAVNSA